LLLWEMHYDWDEYDNEQKDGWNVCLEEEEMKNEAQGEKRQCGG